jgi:hypothetical protein
MAIDPLAGLKLRDEMRQRNAPKLTTLAEGATLLSTDPVTGKTTRVAAGGPNPNKPFFIGEDGQMQPNPAYQAYELAKASAGRSSTNVILPTLEREEQKAKGTANVRYFSETVTPAADAARRGNALLESQRRTIESGFETGWGVPQIAGAANVLGSVFGIKDAERYASKAATFQAAMFDQVLQKQLAQKGPQTESDAARMQQTLAQASTPAAASKFLIDFATAQNDRDIGRQKFFADWWRKKGTYEGAEEAWNDAEGGVSIFSSPRLQTYGGAKPAGFRYLGKEQ